VSTHVPSAELVAIYDQHPLREETILARVLRQRGTLDGITELDLAHDSLTEITDQNHIGGVATVVQLAARAGVGPDSRVLDIGAGLSGAGRVLAALFGCRVHGVELSPHRCADGNRLTQRVGLDARVTCSSGDALLVDLPSRSVDVVWGQGAWMHIADLPALFRRAAAVLVDGGRVAFEEGCLMRAPRTEDEARALTELERLWAGRFQTESKWRELLANAGFDSCTSDDLTAELMADCERLFAIARSHAVTDYPADEANAFPLALDLARAGLLQYRRFVATIRSGSRP